MNTTEKAITGFVLVLATLGSAGLTTLLNQDNPTYQCESKGLISDCINGVKACSGGICTRCYYDPENTRKYEVCSEGWEKMVKELEPIKPDVPAPSGVSGATKYLCGQIGCIVIQ